MRYTKFPVTGMQRLVQTAQWNLVVLFIQPTVVSLDMVTLYFVLLPMNISKPQ